MKLIAKHTIKHGSSEGKFSLAKGEKFDTKSIGMSDEQARELISAGAAEIVVAQVAAPAPTEVENLDEEEDVKADGKDAKKGKK